MRGQKRPRRRNLIPAAERLEPRIALSAEIGVNLGPNTEWNNDPIWTDLHNLASSWTPTHGLKPCSEPPTAILWQMPRSAFATENYPDGNYEFSYTGAGTVAFSDVGQLAGPVTVSDGVTTGTVVVNHALGDGNWLTMQVTDVNPSNPMDNFHLMMPGYGNGTTPEPMFTPAFLQSLAAVLGHPVHELGRDQRFDARQLVGSRDRPPTSSRDGPGRCPLRGHDRAVQRGAEGHVDQHPGPGHASASSRAWPSSSTPTSTRTSTSTSSTATRPGTRLHRVLGRSQRRRGQPAGHPIR